MLQCCELCELKLPILGGSLVGVGIQKLLKSVYFKLAIVNFKFGDVGVGNDQKSGESLHGETFDQLGL